MFNLVKASDRRAFQSMIWRNFVILVRFAAFWMHFWKLYFPFKIIFFLVQMSGRKFVDFVRAELGEFLSNFL